MFYYSIFQLPASNKRCFRPVDYDEINLGNYVHVWKMKSSEKVDLEDIFELLNLNHPRDYHARSLSVSDVVMVRNTQTNSRKVYVVASFGFKEVKEVST